MSKYHSKKMVVFGITFDSRKEGRRYLELLDLEALGVITDLKRQVTFELVPNQYEDVPTGEVYKQGAKTGQPKIKRRVAEYAIKYIADFVYTDERGNMVVEDVKSPATRTEAYILKRKLMLYIHGIKVQEV